MNAGDCNRESGTMVEYGRSGVLWGMGGMAGYGGVLWGMAGMVGAWWGVVGHGEAWW